MFITLSNCVITAVYCDLHFSFPEILLLKVAVHFRLYLYSAATDIVNYHTFYNN